MYYLKDRRILVPHGAIEKISADCKCCRRTVTLCLRGAIDNDNAEFIRRRALEFYGGVYANRPQRQERL